MPLFRGRRRALDSRLAPNLRSLATAAATSPCHVLPGSLGPRPVPPAETKSTGLPLAPQTADANRPKPENPSENPRQPAANHSTRCVPAAETCNIISTPSTDDTKRTKGYRSLTCPNRTRPPRTPTATQARSERGPDFKVGTTAPGSHEMRRLHSPGAPTSSRTSFPCLSGCKAQGTTPTSIERTWLPFHRS